MYERYRHMDRQTLHDGKGRAWSSFFLSFTGTPLERCCVHNMSPFDMSSGLSPGSHEAKLQWAKVCLNCFNASITRQKLSSSHCPTESSVTFGIATWYSSWTALLLLYSTVSLYGTLHTQNLTMRTLVLKWKLDNDARYLTVVHWFPILWKFIKSILAPNTSHVIRRMTGWHITRRLDAQLTVSQRKTANIFAELLV